MNSSLARRLRAVEDRAPKPQERSEFAELFKFMSLNELGRMDDILKRAFPAGALTLPRDVEDFRRLVHAAWQRREAGDPPPTVEASAWSLVWPLQRRHTGFCANDLFRFDLLDVSLDEVRDLGQLMETASSRADLAGAVDVITRLRFDGEPMDMNSFTTMVLEGKVPPA
jgi:hypothetical protein